MPSTEKLVSQLSQIEDLLQKLQKQTSDVRGVRKDISAAAGQLGTTADALQNLASLMTGAAKTMQSLDMEATLKRVDDLENRIVDRSSQLSDTLTESMASLSVKLSESVSELLSQMPASIGEVIEATLKDTKQTITDSNKEMVFALGTQIETTVGGAIAAVRSDFSEAEEKNRMVISQIATTFDGIAGQVRENRAAFTDSMKTVERNVIESISKFEKRSAALSVEAIDAARELASSSSNAYVSTQRWAKLACVLALLAAVGAAAAHTETVLPKIKRFLPAAISPSE